MSRTGKGRPSLAHVQAQQSVISALLAVVDELQAALITHAGRES